VGSPVTIHAYGDQICFIVGSRSTSKLEMMNLQLFHRSTVLTVPAVALENLSV
jgi:hypothetical protein